MFIKIINKYEILILLIICLIDYSLTGCVINNIACQKGATQGSNWLDYYAPNSVDGDLGSFSHTNLSPVWLMIDIVMTVYLEKISIYGRAYENQKRSDYFIIGLKNTKENPEDRSELNLCGQWSGKADLYGAKMELYCSYQTMKYRYLIVLQPASNVIGFITVYELEAYQIRYVDCPTGLYNMPVCNKVCHCANGFPCDQTTGVCGNGCLKDWSGQSCDQYLYEWKNALEYKCFQDSNNIATFIFSSTQMTTLNCINICFDKGFVFAALYKGNECHCGNETYDPPVNTNTNCLTKCSGDVNTYCGGDDKNKNFYKVCPPNYFGYKCRFKCNCFDGKECRYPDGKCPDDDKCDTFNNYRQWIPPTCHLRDCSPNKLCDVNSVCKSDVINGIQFWFCDCKPGYQYVNDTCIDIDECLKVSSNNCSEPSEKCENIPGGFRCICNEGFFYRPGTGCIDKCLLPMYNKCSESNERCKNFVDRIDCVCKDGFYRSESDKKCIDIDECSNSLFNNCSELSERCINFDGGYNCTCYEGFNQSQAGCIDKCLIPFHNKCTKPGEKCKNYIDRIECICDEGLHRSENGCTDKIVWPIIVGVILGILFLGLLLAVSILLYCRYRRTKDKEITNRKSIAFSNIQARKSGLIDQIEENLAAPDDLNEANEENAYANITKKDYEEEFKRLPAKPLRSYDYGRLESNRPKNRFKNITPYDDTRLKLKIINEDEYSDYINATFIQAPDGTKVIATQGPNVKAMNDFWRMLIENDVGVIVMLCSLLENDKVKCDQYWPSNGTQVYGDASVEFQSETKWLDFIERHFLLKSNNNDSKPIAQYQFTGWPDHGIPRNITSLLTMRKMANQEWTRTKSVPIIHCSAGVGRTGCFIAINNMLEARSSKRELSVFDCVNNMRMERQQMVQTLEQYKFIYSCLSTQIDLGATTYTVQEFQERFTKDSLASDKLLRNQFCTLEKIIRKKKKVPTATLR